MYPCLGNQSQCNSQAWRWQQAAMSAAWLVSRQAPPPPPPPPLPPASAVEDPSTESGGSDDSGSDTHSPRCPRFPSPVPAVAPAAAPDMEAKVEGLRQRLLASPFFKNLKAKAADVRLQARMAAAMNIDIKEEVADAGEASQAPEAQLLRRAASGHASLSQVVERIWRPSSAVKPRPSYKEGLVATSRRSRNRRGGRRVRKQVVRQSSTMTIPKWTKHAKHGVKSKGKGKGKRKGKDKGKGKTFVFKQLPRPIAMPVEVVTITVAPRPRPSRASSVHVHVGPTRARR